MMKFSVSKSPVFSALAGAAIVFSAQTAQAGASKEDASLMDCVHAARSLGGGEYREVNRRVQQNASVFEYWVSSAENNIAPRIYCRVNIRLSEIEEVAFLPTGKYRP